MSMYSLLNNQKSQDLMMSSVRLFDEKRNLLQEAKY